jgi:hypothetical protein
VSAQPASAPEAPRRRAPTKAAPAAPRPTLRGRLALVPTPTQARRAPFVILLLVLLAGALIGLLLLNTASAQDSFRLHALQDEEAVLAQQQNALTGMADGLDDPATLAKKAAALGLVPGGPPQFLSRGVPIPKGAIRVGNLIYAPNVVPVATPAPPPTPAAKTTTKPAVRPAVKKPVAKTPVATHAPVVPGKTAVAKAPVAGVTKAPVATATTLPVATATKAPAATRSTAPVAGGH